MLLLLPRLYRCNCEIDNQIGNLGNLILIELGYPCLEKFHKTVIINEVKSNLANKYNLKKYHHKTKTLI